MSLKFNPDMRRSWRLEHTGFVCMLGGHDSCSKNEVFRLRHTEQAGESLGTARTRDDAQLRLWETNLGHGMPFTPGQSSASRK